MPKRRRLPAPPLVLTPHLVTLSEDAPEAPRLVELGRFLSGRKLLTDGGEKNLGTGLRGRNGRVSLGLQDVRSHSHALVLELWAGETEDWSTLAELYYQRFDRGKPRRPTHLQRLYLAWSGDYSWPGLLTAAAYHPRLWPEIRKALDRQERETLEVKILRLAWRCRTHPELWLEEFRKHEVNKEALLLLLPRVENLTPSKRLQFLEGLASSLSTVPAWSYSLVEAAQVTMTEARVLPGSALLEEFAAEILRTHHGFHGGEFLSAFRAFIKSEATVGLLESSIQTTDPLRRVSYGARPGKNWLEELKRELLTLVLAR